MGFLDPPALSPAQKTIIDGLPGSIGTLAKPSLSDSAARGSLIMQELGGSNRSRSAAQARAVYDDTRSTQFVETWANFSSWSTSATVQVANGRLYGNGGGSAAGINHALNLAAGATCRIVTSVSTIGAAGGGNFVIGISSDTAGATMTAGATTVKGLAFHAPASGVVKFDNSVETSSSNTTAYVASSTYTVTILIDANYYSIVAVSADGTQEYRAQWARGSVTPNNLTVYNGDTAGLSGRSLGPVAIEYGITTATPRSSTGGKIEGNQRTVLWSANPNATGMIRVALPPTYDARIPTPFALMWHGHSSDEVHWADNGNGKVVANSLLAAGFIVIGFKSSTTTPWGAQVELDAGLGAYQYARDNLNLGPGVFYCNSMGSIDGLLALAEKRIPGIMAYVGTSPTFSLLANYSNGSQPFTAAINVAHGVTSGTLSASAASAATTLSSSTSFAAGTKLIIDATGIQEQVTVAPAGPSGAGPYTLPLVAPLALAHASGVNISDYPTKTAGRDPNLLSPDVFRGLPILVVAASDDTTVTSAANAVPLLAKLSSYAPEVLSKVDATGGHSFDFTPYTIGTSPLDIVNFAKKYVAM